MPLLTIHINVVLEDPDSTIRWEEGIKDIQTGKEEIKLSLFTNDMVFYIKKKLQRINNNKKSLLELIHGGHSKVVGYKLNTQKPIALLQISNS